MSGALSSNLVAHAVVAGVGRVHLNDPRHRNALSKQLSDQLAAAVSDVIADGAAAIVLTAEPPVFCAGGSLEGLLKREVPLAQTYAGYLALTEAPVPTIAAVAGAAVGAGVNLPLACDVVIAAESARFDPRFLDVGIHPGGGHLWRLVQRIGVQGAAALSPARRHAFRCGSASPRVGLAMCARRRPRIGRAGPGDSGHPTLGALGAADKADAASDGGLNVIRRGLRMELDAQEWSVNQPEFAETVRRVQADIAARKSTATTTSPRCNHITTIDSEGQRHGGRPA